MVSGTFRNISGAISSIDPAAATFTLKDLATKKVFTIHVPKDTQMRRIPEMMARMLAARLSGASATGAGARAAYAPSGASSAAPGSTSGAPRSGGQGGITMGQASGAGRRSESDAQPPSLSDSSGRLSRKATR